MNMSVAVNVAVQAAVQTQGPPREVPAAASVVTQRMQQLQQEKAAAAAQELTGSIQTDMLKAVSNLLQQSQSVSI